MTASEELHQAVVLTPGPWATAGWETRTALLARCRAGAHTAYAAPLLDSTGELLRWQWWVESYARPVGDNLAGTAADALSDANELLRALPMRWPA